MSLPAGVTTCNVIFNTPLSFAGGTGTATLTVRPTQTIIWAATGQPLGAFSDTVTTSAQPGSMALPVVDQAGFVDSAGNTVTNWAYTADVLWTVGTQNLSTHKSFQLLTGQTSVTFDLIPDGNTTIAVTAPTATVTSVNGATGPITLNPASVGLSNVDNTSDANKPLSTAASNALVLKQDAASLDTTNAGLVNDSASATAAALNATYGTTVIADGSADHTAKINAALSATTGTDVVRTVRLVGAFNTSAPIIVGSNTKLDATNATITLINASSCNLLNTAANAPLRTVTDAAITAASTTLTSATAAFTSADVGRNIYVAGAGTAAGSGGLTGLYTTIVSVTSDTQAVLASPGITTVSAASLSVYTRCANIEIVGGTWDHGASQVGTGTGISHIVMRRVDGLTMRGMTIQGQSNFGHGLNVGDVTDFLIEDIGTGIITTSDYIHVNGPATRGTIQRISGMSGDDFVALTAMDYALYSDVYGPITDIDIKDIAGIPTTAMVKLTGSQEAGAYLDRIRISNASYLGTTDTSANFYGLQCLSDTGTLDLRDVTVSGLNGRILIQAGQNANLGGYVKTLTIDAGRYAPPTHSYPLVSITGAAIETLNIHGVTTTLAAVSTGPIIQLDKTAGGTPGTITSANVSNVNWTGNAGTNLVYLLSAGCSISALKLSNVRFINPASGGAIITANVAGVTVPNVFLDNVEIGCGWVADMNCTSTFWMTNVTATVGNGTFRIRSAGAITVRGAGISASATGMTIDAGGTAHSMALDFPVDLSKLSRTAGDRATNTNAALSCGIGPVITDGTTWKNLYTGATY